MYARDSREKSSYINWNYEDTGVSRVCYTEKSVILTKFADSMAPTAKSQIVRGFAVVEVADGFSLLYGL